MTPYHPHARRGTLLVVVLGLITIFLALMLAITVRVYNSTKGGTALQQNVQAYLMMIAAKKVSVLEANVTGSFTFPLTAGDDPALYTGIGRPFADSLGWFHMKNATTVVAVGGSSAKGAAKTSINSGAAERNAYEIRLYYTFGGTAPNLIPQLQPVADNATYW